MTEASRARQAHGVSAFCRVCSSVPAPAGGPAWNIAYPYYRVELTIRCELAAADVDVKEPTDDSHFMV
jgi:hypothetical protein